MKMKFPRKRIPLQTFLFAFAVVQSASALTMPELLPPVFADTEVSTNVAMRAWGENTRLFNVSLSFDATPSNNVQVAFGTDESADDNLSDEETGLTLGWDCGSWFVSGSAVSNRFAAAPAGAETRKELSLRISLGADGLPRKLELADGTSPLAFAGIDLSPPPPAWMFSKDWNLLKVVARGTDEQNEQITVVLSNDAVMLLLR